MKNDIRLVSASRELRDQLADLLRYLHPDSREPIKSLVAAWDAAPADPAEAVRIAISAEWMNTGMGNEERIDEVYDREGAAIYRTRAVLACLGYANPRNEDHA